MRVSRSKAKVRRYLRELIHKFRFTYEDISQYTGIDVDRLKALNQKEEPSKEEAEIIGKFTIKMSMSRAEEDGE